MAGDPVKESPLKIALKFSIMLCRVSMLLVEYNHGDKGDDTIFVGAHDH